MSFSIPFTDVIVENRIRDGKKYGDITSLRESLAAVGSIHPIVLSKRSDGKYDLVAGGRRHLAMTQLNTMELWHASTLDPTKLGFVFAEEVPADIRKEAELDENLHRLNMDWIDTCLAIADLHEMKKSKNTKWGFRQTAEILGKGYNRTSANYAVLLAKRLRDGDKEIAACSNMSEAVAVLLKRKEEEALAKLASRVEVKNKVAGVGMPAPQGLESFLDRINMTLQPKAPTQIMSKPVGLDEAMAVLDSPPPTSSVPATGEQPAPVLPSTPPVEIPLSVMFQCGDSLHGESAVLPQLREASFDHIVTDIPYGIDMDNLKSLRGIEDVKDEHEVDVNIDQMKPFLEQAFRLIKPKGFCVFFYDLDHHEKLQRWAEEVGFGVQRWPLIWHKLHNCKNEAAAFNTTKNFEVAMVLRKDGQTVLRSPQLSSVKSCDGSHERRLYHNPFAKPYDLWKWIYDMIAFPGQTVLDPFCGEMSACRAAANCGLIPFGIEVNENHFRRGLQHMQEAYALIHHSNVLFT